MRVGDKYRNSEGTVYYITSIDDYGITLASEANSEEISSHDIRDYFHSEGLKYIGHESDDSKIPGEVIHNDDDLYDDEINETLRLAGVQLNEDWFSEHQSKNANTVKDLIEKLQQCDPNAIVIVSEKPGRGGASCYVYQGYTDKNGFYLSDEQNEEYNIPAIEITCDF